MRLFNRHKVLLNTIKALNRNRVFSRRAIVKSQFLLKKEYGVGKQVKFYNFYPYKQGPFSQLCFYDLRNLRKNEILNNEETKLTEKGEKKTKSLDKPFEAKIKDLLNRFSNEKEMTDYVYKKYPKFTVRSELIEQNTKKPGRGIITIGYEKKDIDRFLNMLTENGVDMVIDIRKNAFSMNFCYTKSNLLKFLNSVGIEYLHIPELGIKGQDRKNLESKEDYDKLFRTYRKKLPLKEVYINRIIELSKKQRVALLCYEDDVNFCHRGQIANFIRKKEIEVKDI